VLFYTDGLIEHGRTEIDEGLAALTEQLTEVADLPLEKICDQLLDHIAPGRADDDIAILAVRCHPEFTDKRPPRPQAAPDTTASAAAAKVGPGR
jgi:hypothetical protein